MDFVLLEESAGQAFYFIEEFHDDEFVFEVHAGRLKELLNEIIGSIELLAVFTDIESCLSECP